MEKKSETTKLYNLDIWIYNRIKFFNEKDMIFYESNKSLGEKFNRHQNRISASISKLLRLGYIENLSENKFQRQLKVKKEININGVSFNINGASFNNLSVEEITRMLTEINKSGVKKLTKAVLEVNKNGDLYKELIKIFNKDINTKEITSKSYDNHKIIHMDNDNVFNETLNNFKVMRKQLKKPLTEHGEKLLMKELEKLANTEEEKIAILNQSILNSWQGVFPLKVNITQNKPTTLQELRALVKADKTDHWTKDDWRHYNEMNTQAIRSGV